MDRFLQTTGDLRSGFPVSPARVAPQGIHRPWIACQQPLASRLEESFHGALTSQEWSTPFRRHPEACVGLRHRRYRVASARRTRPRLAAPPPHLAAASRVGTSTLPRVPILPLALIDLGSARLPRRLDHRLHQFESIEYAAKARFGIHDDQGKVIGVKPASLGFLPPSTESPSSPPRQTCC